MPTTEPNGQQAPDAPDAAPREKLLFPPSPFTKRAKPPQQAASAPPQSRAEQPAGRADDAELPNPDKGASTVRRPQPARPEPAEPPHNPAAATKSASSANPAKPQVSAPADAPAADPTPRPVDEPELQSLDEFAGVASRPASDDAPAEAGGSAPDAPQVSETDSAEPLTARRPIASVRDVHKAYGKDASTVKALDGVSVDFYAGEFTAIMGPSGSGKSTLMHCTAGLDAATSGLIVVGDHDVTNMTDRQLTAFRRHHVGFIFQSFNLLPTLTAEQNITLPVELARKKLDKAWYERVIDAVGIRDRLSHTPSELSGGQQQRVACARAMVAKPDIIFADEPTGNLDTRASHDVLQFLADSVTSFGQSIVMVTHEPTAAAYADRVLFLADGQFVSELREPTTQKVLDHMARIRNNVAKVA